MKKEIEFALWVAENTYTSHYDDDGVLIFGSDIYNEDYLTIERLYELFKQDTQ